MKRSIKLIILSAIAFVFSLAMFFINSPKAEAAGSKTVDSLTIAQMYANKDTGKCGNFSWNPSDLETITSSGFKFDFWANSDRAFKIVWTKPSDMAYPSTLKYGYSIADGDNKDSASKNFNSDPSTKPSLPMGGDGRRQYTVVESTLYSNYDKVVFWLGHSYMADDLNVTSITFELKTATAAVKGTAGTGVKSVFFSTSADATSGSASGTEFDKDKTVYAYAVLKEGYKAQNSWTLIDGTANSENSIYRVAEKKLGSSDHNFGTINAELKTGYIIFDKNGGGNSTSQQITYGQSATLSPTSRNGYSFLGWNSKQDGTGTAYGDENGATLTVEQVNEMVLTSYSTTLYAQWSVNTYTIIFDTNDGTGGPDPIELTYGDPFPVLTATELPTRVGYEFGGYRYTAPDHNVKTIYNADGTVALNPNESYIYEDDAHLYPIWKGLPYPVYITAGTGVSSVFLNRSFNQTSGSPSGTTFTNGDIVEGYIVLERGYKAPGTWTRVTTGPEPDVGGAIYYTGGTVDLGYDFGTVNAILGTYPVNITKGTGLKNVKVSANADGTNLVNSGSKFDYNSKVYAYATLAKGYYAPSTWTLISDSDTANTEDALYLVGIIENIDITNDFGTINATPKTYPVTLDGLTDPINATYDADMPTLTELPNKAGYTLVGYWNEDGTTQYYNNLGESTHIWDQDGTDFTLVAKWTKDFTYEVTDYHDQYDGNSHTFSINVKDPANGYEILYGIEENNYNLTEAPTYTEPGTYTIYFTISATVGDVVYTTVFDQATVQIDKAIINYTSLPTTKDNLVYNDTDFDLINLAQLNEDYGTVLYKVVSEDNSVDRDYDSAMPVGHNATTYTIYYKTTGNDRYAAIEEASLTVVIAQVDKDSLALLISAVSTYLGTIKDDYNQIYTALNETNTQITTNAYDNPNVTEEYVENSITTLANALAVAKANVTDAKIAAIGNPVNNDEYRAKVENARNYINENYVDTTTLTNLNDLVNYEAVVGFMDEVNAIGDAEDTVAFRNKVSAARASYVALTPEQSNLVPADVLAMLTDYEKAIEVMDAINAIGNVEYTPSSKQLIDAAQTAYDALSDKQKDLVANHDKLVQANLDYDNVAEALAKLKNMLSLSCNYNDESKAGIDTARKYYDDLSDYQKLIYGEENLNKIIDYETAYDAMKKIAEIGNIENTKACKDRIDLANKEINALTDAQMELVDEDLLKILEDRDAAFNVIEKINDAKKVKYTKDSKDKLDAANDAYDKLTDEQKALVVNYNDLIKADKDYKEVEKVVNEINNLGKLSYSEDTNKKITDARKNYTELTNDQSSFFPEETKKTLENYENAYVVLAKIHSIGEVEYTEESEKLIADAKNDYEALNNAEKGLISDEDLAILNNANDSYSSKNTAGIVWFIILLILVLATIGAGVFFIFLLLRKKDNNKPQKAMSVSPFGLLFLASHLAGGKFITLYVFTGIAVAIWIAVLVIYILKKKGIIMASNVSYNTSSIEDKPNNKKEVLTPEQKEEKKQKAYLNKTIECSEIGIQVSKDVSYEEDENGIEAVGIVYNEKSRVYMFGPKNEKLKIGDVVIVLDQSNSKRMVPIVMGNKKISEEYIIQPFKDILEVVYRRDAQNDQTPEKQEEPEALPEEPIQEEKVTEEEIQEESVEEVQEEPVEEVQEEPSKDEEAETEDSNEEEHEEAPIEAEEEDADSNVEEEETVTVTDETGHVFQVRYNKSFTAKMSQASDELKEYYNQIKNCVLSYKKTNSRVSWGFDSINIGRTQAMKFAIRGKTLCVYYALDEVDGKYKVETTESKKYAAVPKFYRVKNDRRCEYAKELVDILMRKLHIEKGKESNEDFKIPFEETNVLIEKGLIKETKTEVKN